MAPREWRAGSVALVGLLGAGLFAAPTAAGSSWGPYIVMQVDGASSEAVSFPDSLHPAWVVSRMEEPGWLTLSQDGTQVFRVGLSGDGGQGEELENPGTYTLSLSGQGEAAIVDGSRLAAPYDEQRGYEVDVDGAFAFSITGDSPLRLCFQAGAPTDIEIRDFDFVKIAEGRAANNWEVLLDEGDTYPRAYDLDFVTVFLETAGSTDVRLLANTDTCSPPAPSNAGQDSPTVALPSLVALLALGTVVARRHRMRQ